jgi:hypothetical protein
VETKTLSIATGRGTQNSLVWFTSAKVSNGFSELYVWSSSVQVSNGFSDLWEVWSSSVTNIS